MWNTSLTWEVLCHVDKDVDSRVAKASAAFGRLQKRVFKNHSLHIPTKIAVYNAIVVSTLRFRILGVESKTH